MIESDGIAFNPAEPANETIIRVVKSCETPQFSDDLKVEPARWNVGDDLGSFVIEAAIGSGVTSSVYRVREKTTGRIFAMKILRTRSDAMLTASRVGFRRIQKLNHPSLVRCNQMLLVGDNLAFTMEEVVGKRLIDVINETRSENRAATFELAIHLLHDIGGALQAIHDAGLVHRDVKPDNVMIDQHGRARLIDYGLVGSYDPESDPDAQRGYLAGTYWYMAPECLTKQIYPPACDVYSLGCMLLELIADPNRLPQVSEGNSLGQSLDVVRSYLPVDTPDELADLICDMVDPAPENRPLAARLTQVKIQKPRQARSQNRTKFTSCQLHGRALELDVAQAWIHSVIDGRPKRLHISGESGVGKTWFLQELMRRLRSNAWFQVFDSACRERSDVPLQTFDAMADAIARRYSRDDREKLRLAPRHAAVLRQAFPSLRGVIIEPRFSEDGYLADGDQRSKANQTADTPANLADIARSDALLAGVELVDRMCDYGPIFLIVDDIQWADADSINVLDKLISNANVNTGIISVGRSRNDDFREPADCYIELGPLSEDDSLALLRQLLCTKDFLWSDQALQALAKLGDGNAYCITQLAACVGRDDANGWHDRLISTQVEVEHIWQSRVNQLSEDAKTAIEFLAIAGGPIARSELAPASKLGDRCETAIFELIDLHLVYDEAPKREAVSIVHQRVARSIVGAIEPDRYRSLHNAWARYLMQGGDVPWHAARIAGHLLKADQAESALPYIIQAARDAEARFAFTEAARWHHRAACQLSGADSATHWLETVQCFEEAGCPAEAAGSCQTLLDHPAMSTVNWSATTIRKHLAENLFRSGDVSGAVQILDSIVSLFDPQWNDFNPARRLERISRALRTHGASTITNTQESSKAADKSVSAQVDLRSESIDACIALYKPLLAFDIDRAIKLLVSIYVAIGNGVCPAIDSEIALNAAVIGCRNPGPRRRRNAERLNRAVDDAIATGDSTLIAQANSAVAFRHFAACDWASSTSHSLKSIALSRSQNRRDRLGDAFSRLPMNWSCLWLGRLRDLRASVHAMTCDAEERNDQSVSRLARLGLGCAADLMEDKATSHGQASQTRSAPSSAWEQMLGGFSRLLQWQYDGDIGRAARYHRVLVSGQRAVLLKNIQLLRVLSLQFEGTIHMGSAVQNPRDQYNSLSIVKRVCQDLKKERISYANAIGTYFEAQIHEVLGDQRRSASKYARAARIAESLGLIPLQLAAKDRYHIARNESKPSELKDFLTSEGVKSPENFARLFCGLASLQGTEG